MASPFHLANHNENINSLCGDLHFHQERGTGQGDPPSPILWNALFDVLLDMLAAMPNDGAYYAQSSVSRLYRVHDTAYADDLASTSATFQSQQAKADIICTFCACTGMEIAMAKIRSFAINSSTTTPNILLHNSQWEATTIPSCTDAFSAKYLGFLADHINDDESAFIATEQYLQKSTGILIHSNIPKDIKLLVYRMQIVPKVLYVATKACWSLKQYRLLDKFPSQLLKHIGGHMPSSPNAMLYFPADQCGSGLHPISDLAQSQKWGQLARALDTPNDAALAANGLIERALRQTAQQSMSSAHRQIFPRNLKYLKCFAGSLVEWGNSISLALTHSPEFVSHDSNTAILPFIDDSKESDHVIRVLQRRDITAQGELCRSSHNGEMRWETDKDTQLILHALGDNAIHHPTDNAIILNNGQIYRMDNRIVEIIGVINDSNSILCYEWFQLDAPKHRIIRMIYHNLATVAIDYNQFVAAPLFRITSVPSSISSLPDRYCARRIVAESRCNTPSLGQPLHPTLPSSLQLFVDTIQMNMELHHCNYSIFTDGSFQKGRYADTYILMSSSEATAYGTASAALIAIADSEDWLKLPVATLMLSPSDQAASGLNAFTSELIALTAAVHVQRAIPISDVFTDCKSALATVMQACSVTAKRSKLCAIRAAVNSLRGSGRPNITWKRSHPERCHPDDSSWSRNDWGIFLADLAAKGDFNEMLKYHDNITCIDTSLTSLLTDLIPPGLWYWAKLNTVTPALLSPIKCHAADRVSNYFEKRDIERTKRIMHDAAIHRPQDMSQDDIDDEEDALWVQGHKWTDTSLGLANRCWRTIAKGIIQSNSILKNVLDKYWHGKNRAKDPSAPCTAALCRICNAEDSQVHILLQCHHPDLDDIRANAINDVLSLVDELISVSTPLCDYATNLIQFFSSHFTVDRLWLGTWNRHVLRAALCNGTPIVTDTMSYSTAMFIQSIIIKLTQPLVKATKMLMFQSHKIIAQSNKTLIHFDVNIRRSRSYSCVVANSAFPAPARPRTTAARPRSARSARTASSSSRRSKLINRRRCIPSSSSAASVVWIPTDDEANSGYFASPHGATESCDYDKD